MDERSDKNLVEASCAGDRKAYAALVKKYHRYVFLVCMGMLGNVADAEDIAQDAMLKGFVDISKLRDGSQFSPWVTRIAKNMCINLVRREKHSRKAFEEKAKQLNESTTENDRLQQAIEKLPQETRLPLLMYYFDGQSVKTVAERMNISVPGVYLKLRAATEQLHELLVKQGD
ncbi:MAG: RNA polymerase sigma factor [Planctomycetota bacterium]